MKNIIATQTWGADECHHGGLIISFGDPKDFKVQRLQIVDLGVAKAVAKVPEMIAQLEDCARIFEEEMAYEKAIEIKQLLKSMQV
jgi:hypothetical protein